MVVAMVVACIFEAEDEDRTVLHEMPSQQHVFFAGQKD